VVWRSACAWLRRALELGLKECLEETVVESELPGVDEDL
jgi:hypothetical protein